ncbi:extracellular solute-binding protein [Paenibacillus sp. YIM B09110]|uniref:extracellular solute-binding protein n=1 Tax=Paenibacillus sp. YIM B09110 TaxID=3126102 RepID=UPI00301D5BAB
MRHEFARYMLVIAVVSIQLGLAACSGVSGDNGINTGSPNEMTELNPYLGKYDPPIEISTFRIIDDNVKFAGDEDMDNNQWTRTLMEKLGIRVRNQWIVKGDLPGGPGEQKMNVSIATGELPDFFPVTATQLKQLADSDQLMDLTELYEQYASPQVKEMVDKAMNDKASAVIGGRLLGVPRPVSTIDGSSILWIRKDWLTKLQLPEPESMDDLLRISEAFTNKDPDGNGISDTYGLAVTMNLYGSAFSNGYFGTLEGFFNGYHAYPQQWIRDISGRLVFGSIQPEMKAALTKLQELYRSGQLDPEFAVKDEVQEGIMTSTGRIGITYGAHWVPLSNYLKDRKNDDSGAADWHAYPIVSADNDPARVQIPGSGVDRFFYAVNKDAEHPEALFKMINLFAELQFGSETSTADWQKHSKMNGIEIWRYFPFPVGPVDKNVSVHENVVAALESGDPSLLNPEEADAYKRSIAVESGNYTVDDWAYDKVFGRGGSQAVINHYLERKLLKPGEFYGIATPTMSEKLETLRKMEIEMVTKVIMGNPISDFDKFVADWKQIGGEQITREVNDWFESTP